MKLITSQQLKNLGRRNVSELKEKKQSAAIEVAKKAYDLTKNQITDSKELEKVDAILHALQNDVEGDERIKIQGFRNLIQPSNQHLLNWLAKFKDNYLSHAIFSNVEKVLDDGMLKPAEMILREGRDVDFEGGGFTQRAQARLPNLEESEVQELKHCLLTEEEKERLMTLEKTLDFSKAKDLLNQFKKISKDFVDAETVKAMRSFEGKLELLKEDPLLKDYVEYHELKRKQRGIFLRMRDKLDFSQEKKTTFYPIAHQKFEEIVGRLCIKYGCTPKAVKIAFDHKLPQEERIDFYLFKKFKKGGYSDDDLRAARAWMLDNQKLNPEIRMGCNTIYWHYGDVVVLKGGNENISAQQGEEATMKAPWQNEGKFYTINLQSDPDVIILGPKEILKKYADKYPQKIVYVENLTPEQKIYFGT